MSIIALDIETARNDATIPLLPEPECTDSRIKDKDKIAAHIEAKRAEQLERMALDPLTGRVICYAAVRAEDEKGGYVMADAMTDEAETALIESVFASVLAADGARIVTYNGIGFDIPYIYRRAMLLGIDVRGLGAPPLTAWTKRYATDRHYDLMQVWSGWNSQQYAKLDTLARFATGASKKDIDVTTFPALMATNDGRRLIGEYCEQDTRLTLALWRRMQGVLFA